MPNHIYIIIKFIHKEMQYKNLCKLDISTVSGAFKSANSTYK